MQTKKTNEDLEGNWLMPGIILIENGSIIGTVKERTLVCAIVPHILVAIR